MTALHWPRGRYNGRRIVGLDIHAKIDVTAWRMRWFGAYGQCLWVGPLRVWISFEYGMKV